MKKMVLIAEKKLPEFNWNLLLGSIAFWNEEGQRIYDRNVSGEMNGEAGKAVRGKTPEAFVLQALFLDIIGHPSSLPEGFQVGLSGSHVWISRPDNERVMMICFH